MIFEPHRLTIARLCIMIVYNIKITNSQQRKNKLLHHHTFEKLKKQSEENQSNFIWNYNCVFLRSC